MQPPSLPREIAATLGNYFAGQLKIAGILAILYTAGYAISGVPLWYLLGPLSGALNLVPVAGSILALLLTAFAALWGEDSVRNYAGLLITFVLVQGFEGFYLTPKLLGKRVGLSAVSVFVGIFVGGLLFGPVGILFGVPVLAVAAVVWRRTNQRRR